MTTFTDTAPTGDSRGWFARTETWLDARGKGAWIAAMVLSFIFFWPVGLALLAYMIWSKRMFNSPCSSRKSWKSAAMRGASRTGNRAFDHYKEDTLRRLEQEQDDFESFLERLRAARDKSEFDDFMDERARSASSEDKESA